MFYGYRLSAVTGADQNIFWQNMNVLRHSNGLMQGKYGFRCAHMCGQEPICKAEPEDMLRYCNMNPFLHPTGYENATNKEFLTYHANYVSGMDKITKLKKKGVYESWDPEKN